jgi:predicted protein tyrosine phosphatase
MFGSCNMSEADIAKLLPFRLSVCSLADVSTFAASGVTHLLSIDNPGGPTPTPKWFTGTHWHVVFQDVESDAEAREYSTTPPTRAAIQQVLDNASSCLESSRSHSVYLLVHCMAGASRSTAAAFGILAMVLGPGQEVNALKYLLRIRPDAFPNKLVVRFADEILGRNGRMMEALRPLREEVGRAVDGWAERMQSRTGRQTEHPAGG